MSQNLSVFLSPDGECEALAAYQAVLDVWTAPYTEQIVPTSLGGTHVIVSGPEGAPSVVLLHALFATAASWYGIIGELSRRYRVYAVDVLGEANMSRPTRMIGSLDDFLTWFRELVDALGIRQLSLVGNSYGGFTAAYYAMQEPDRIQKLVLIGPAATIHSMPAFYRHMFIPKMLYLAFPWLPGMQSVMRRSVEWMYAGLPNDGPWKHLFTTTMIHGRMTSRVMPRVYSREECARIKAPTLLILGEQERIYRVDEAAATAQDLIPGIRIRVIPGAHHITAIAQPELVSNALVEFFSERPS